MIETNVDIPVIVVRAIYFASTAMMTGAIVFRAFVAEPVLRSERMTGEVINSQIRLLIWIGFSVAVIAGAIWVVLLTESLSDTGFREAVISGALRDVLTLTQFGMATLVRLALAIVLAIGLFFDRSRWGARFAFAAALGLTASIAWTGHAASTPHGLGYVHLVCDTLHVCAASAWFGGLLPFALLLHAGKQNDCSAWPSLELVSARRFSALGIVSVATLVASGVVNSCILLGSFRELVTTAYGLILMVKLAVFAIMLAFAAVNRLCLTPKLASPSGGGARFLTIRRLTRNTMIEIALGLVIFAIVGLLGTLHPAIHLAR